MADKAVTVKIIPKLAFFLTAKKRLKGAKGGRGGGKSWAVADALLVRMMEHKRRILCCRELQKSIRDSVHQLLQDRIQHYGWQDAFEITDSEIRCKYNSSNVVFYGLRSNVTEIKSLEGVDICWIEEAQKASAESLEILRPTIRHEESEIWATWNTGTGTEPIEKMFAGHPSAILVHIDFRDNPKFPKVLLSEMEHDKKTNPGRYRHIWLGEPGGGGQFFPEFGPHLREMPFKIEAHLCNLYGSLDYGDGKGDNASATSFGLWHVDRDGRPHRLLTYYKRHQTAATYAREIVATIRSFYWTSGVMPKAIFADPSMFIRRNMDENFSKSVADIFGEYGLVLTSANNDRVNGWRVMRDYFTKDERGIPKSSYWEGYNDEYEAFIPTLQCKDNNPDDCDKGGEDHVGDDSRYLFVAAQGLRSDALVGRGGTAILYPAAEDPMMIIRQMEINKCIPVTGV